MKRNILSICAILAAIITATVACKKDTASPPPVNPGGGDTTPTPKRDVIAWVDARSNVFGTYGRLSDTNELKKVLDTLKQVGVNGLVVDVKGSSGFTMYPSSIAKQITSLDGKSLPANVDYAAYMLKQARERGFKVYASIVTMVEGDGGRRIGTIFEDPNMAQYESIVCDINGNRKKVTETGRNAFVNPAQPAVQERALNIIKEIATKYDFDGLILDYCRYTDIDADFSDFSKNEFIKYLETNFNDDKAKAMKFPQDIVTTWRSNAGQTLPATTGKYYNKWLMYRCSVIQQFFIKARETVKAARPGMKFGTYVGAWYTTYYQVGVNWASNEYDPFNDQEVRFDWAYPNYGKTGYGEQLDLLMTGNYFTQIRLADNPATAHLKYHWWSVEGSLNGGMYITRNKMPLYGSIDMGNVDWANTGEITKAIQYILGKASGGIMLFDVVHIYAPQYNRLKQPLWDAVKNGLNN